MSATPSRNGKYLTLSSPGAGGRKTSGRCGGRTGRETSAGAVGAASDRAMGRGVPAAIVDRGPSAGTRPCSADIVDSAASPAAARRPICCLDRGPARYDIAQRVWNTTGSDRCTERTTNVLLGRDEIVAPSAATSVPSSAERRPSSSL